MKSILSELRENNFVLPDYKNSNLAVIKGIAAKEEGIGGDKSKKIFLTVDGLGYKLLEDLMDREKSMISSEDAEVNEISTLFPSTTTAVTCSFESGKTPAEHGVIGWDMYQKEFGLVVTPYADSPPFARGLSLKRAGIPSVLPEPELLRAASKKGSAEILFPAKIAAGKKIQNCKRAGYYSTADMFVQLKKTVERDEVWFVYAYYDGIDLLEHVYGFRHQSVKEAIATFFRELKGILLPRLRGSDYNLVITADHGLVEAKKKVIVRYNDKIMQYLAMPPWGDSRVLYMNVLPGKEDALCRLFDAKYGKDAVLADSDRLIRTGIFGKNRVNEKVRSRFGTHIALMKDDRVIRYDYPLEKQKKFELRGFHSGLSELEMKVPLIIY